MNNLSLAIQNFNNKVKQMNQSGGRQLTLNADEARNLHADIFTLLANLAEATATEKPAPASDTLLDGGGFK